MRQLSQNKRVLYYAQYREQMPVYVYDEDGNILTTNVDGEEVEVVDQQPGYSAPVKFKANISFNSGETRLAEYGLNDGDYNAIISANKGELPFDERTLIWLKEPQYEGGYIVDADSNAMLDSEDNNVCYINAIIESADYRVVAIKTSLNEERFMLKKRVDD